MKVTNDNITSREKKGKIRWTLEELQAEVKAKEIKTSKEYIENAPKHNWPSKKGFHLVLGFPKNPDGSPDWDKFLGREGFDFETFREQVIASGAKTIHDYLRLAPKYKWPYYKVLTTKPEFPKKLDGSNDWQTFLRREKYTQERRVVDFGKLKLEVKRRNIKSANEYIENARRYDWPSYKKLMSMPEFPKKPDGSNDWNAFFGR